MDKSKKELIIRYGLFALAAFVISPIIYMVVKGMVGMALAAFLLLVITQLAPVISMALTNTKIKAVKVIAAANPIETLQAQWIAKQKELEKMAEAVTAFATETKNYQGKVQGFAAKFPHRAPEYQKQAENMQKVVEIQRSKLLQSRAKLNDFQGQIEEASAVWDMTQASSAAMASMAKFSNEDVLEKIKSQTAIDAVTSSLNQVMAELETAISLDYNTIDVNFNPATAVLTPAPALENTPTPVLRVVDTKPVMKRVLRK